MRLSITDSPYILQFPVYLYLDGLGPPGMYGICRNPSVFPSKVHQKISTGLEAPYFTFFFPLIRYGRQEMHITGMALQQHLGDTGGAAKIGVDLERGARREEVGIDAAPGAVVDPGIGGGADQVQI